MKYDSEQMTFVGAAATAEESAALRLHYEIMAAAQAAAASLLDLSRKIIYHFLFFRCQFHLRNSLLLYQFLRLLLHDLCLCLRKGIQCKSRCFFCCCV